MTPPSWAMREKKEENTRKPKAVVVGGSIAGISAAHSLLIAGWDVVVLEKTCAPPSGSPTGAGLGLDPLAQKIIESWIGQPNLLQNSTLPLTIDQVREQQFLDSVVFFFPPKYWMNLLPFSFIGNHQFDSGTIQILLWLVGMIMGSWKIPFSHCLFCFYIFSFTIMIWLEIGRGIGFKVKRLGEARVIWTKESF